VLFVEDDDRLREATQAVDAVDTGVRRGERHSEHDFSEASS
jgi:hypothetical protein